MKKSKLNKYINNKKGFTFVECIVAIALFAIIGTLGFSMFSNSARYMSKAKKDAEKQSQAQEAAQLETFKNADGRYYIYSADLLEIKYIISDPTKPPTAKNYFLKMTYPTDYGNVDVLVALEEAPIKTSDGVATQPGMNLIPPYKRYRVLGDMANTRYVFVYETETYPISEIGNNTTDGSSYEKKTT